MAKKPDKTKKEAPKKTQAKAVSTKKAAPAKAAAATVAPGPIQRLLNYFKAVKSELHRVTWPTKAELGNYTVIVLATLLFFGVFIWLLDTAILPLFIAFSGLRG